MAAPDPVAAPVSRSPEQPDRLRVVDDHDVPIALQTLGVQLVVAIEERPLLVGQRPLIALQRVVQQLGRIEELLLAEHHAPVGVEADISHQRHERVEDLRDAAPEGRRADVEHAATPERLGQLADPLDQRAAAEARVVGQ